MRLTVGPLPPAVYWRRRALVLGAVLLVLFLVAQACLAAAADQDGQAAGEPSSSSTPSPAPPETSGPPTAGPTEDADPPGLPAVGSEDEDEPAGEPDAELGEDACTDAEMLVTAVADPTEFPAGDTVRFTIRIQNDSDRSCMRDVGAGQRELYLRRGSGADRVWSSRDCIDLEGRDVRELPPVFDTTHFVDWNGRSSVSCENSEPAGPVLDPGEYELVARLGTVYSDPLAITVS